MVGKFTVGACAAALFVAPSAHAAATLVGAYGFDGSLASTVAGAPALGVIDPTGTSGFMTDTVFGTSRTVWSFNGNTAPTTGQSGLTFDAAGLLTSDSYSVALTLKFNERQNQWRRIMDVTGRQTDAGFYVDTSDDLAIFPVSGSGVAFNSGEYRNIVLTVSGNIVSAYADGGLSFSTTTTSMAIGAFPLVFFADNVGGGGQGEWSSGSVAALRLFDGVLTQTEIEELNRVPFVEMPSAVPEPATWAMMIGGLALVGAAMRSRRASISFA